MSNIVHAGDCSIYGVYSNICDCGALRKVAREFDQDNYDEKEGEAWVRHLDAIDRSKEHNRRNDKDAPWNQPNDNGENPGDICCQRASGDRCYEHNFRNYNQDNKLKKE